jgi:hypothetical protein
MSERVQYEEVPFPAEFLIADEPSPLEDYLNKNEIEIWKSELEVDSVEEVAEWLQNEVELEFKFRGRVSSDHLQGAISTSRETRRLEEEYASYTGDVPEENGANIIVKHRSLVISSIISTAHFLEAQINQTYDNIILITSGEERLARPEFDNLSRGNNFDALYDLDEILGDSIIRMTGFMQRYQLILSILDREKFDKGRKPWQDINTIRRLRNYFVHYEPEIFSTSNKEEVTHRIGSALQGKYKTNKLRDESDPFFPNRALSYGCTYWAISSAIEFTNEFYNRLGIEPSYEKDDTIALDQYLE